jgi:hypothetical protein
VVYQEKFGEFGTAHYKSLASRTRIAWHTTTTAAGTRSKNTTSPRASSSRQHAAATGREAALFEPRHSASGLSAALSGSSSFRQPQVRSLAELCAEPEVQRGSKDSVRCLRNAAAELECADWSSSSTCSIGSSRRKSRLWRNYHAARDFIVTEEVPCRGPGKRATHFAKCLVHVGTILAHFAATSFYQPGDHGEHRLTSWKKEEVPPNTFSRWHPRARNVVVILRHKVSWKPESRVLGLAVET